MIFFKLKYFFLFVKLSYLGIESFKLNSWLRKNKHSFSVSNIDENAYHCIVIENFYCYSLKRLRWIYRTKAHSAYTKQNQATMKSSKYF